MPGPLKLGFALPSSKGDQPATWTDIRELAIAAEQAGYDSVWHADHVFIEWGPGDRAGRLECWTVMTALATLTSRVRIGSLVLCQSFRDPGILAKMAATLQEIATGRLVLAVGAGWHGPEYEAFGLPFDHLASRFEEYLDILVPLLNNETVRYQGRYHRADGAELLPPAPPIPLWIGSAKERMNAITARRASGWNGAWYGGEPSYFADRVAKLKAQVEAAGRDPESLEYSVGITTIPVATTGEIGPTCQAIRDQHVQFRSLSDDQIRRRVLIDTPEGVANVLRHYYDVGAETLILSPAAIAMGLWSQETVDLLFQAEPLQSLIGYER